VIASSLPRQQSASKPCLSGKPPAKASLGQFGANPALNLKINGYKEELVSLKLKLKYELQQQSQLDRQLKTLSHQMEEMQGILASSAAFEEAQAEISRKLALSEDERLKQKALIRQL